MGSHLTITMLLRSPTILSPLIAIMAARAGPPTWSNLGLLSSQASKRSVEDSNESFLAKDLESSASDSLQDTDSYDMADFKSPEARVEPYRRRKKFRLRRRKNRYEPPLVVPEDGELSPNVLYERDSSYNAPSSSYDAPGYSNSYEPPSYESPSYSPSYEAYGGGKDSFNDFLNALAAFLPIGLFLAAIPPNLIVINSTARRKREAEDSLLNSVDAVATEEDRPVLRRIAALGSAMWKPECQAEIFCQMVKLGQLPEGNSVQRMFAATAIHAPDFATNLLGLGGTFQASREGDCTKFKCGQ